MQGASPRIVARMSPPRFDASAAAPTWTGPAPVESPHSMVKLSDLGMPHPDSLPASRLLCCMCQHACAPSSAGAGHKQWFRACRKQSRSASASKGCLKAIPRLHCEMKAYVAMRTYCCVALTMTSCACPVHIPAWHTALQRLGSCKAGAMLTRAIELLDCCSSAVNDAAAASVLGC